MTSCSTCGAPCRSCGDAFPELPRVALRTSQNTEAPSGHGKRLLSTELVADMLHCTPQHVSRLADRAGIEPAKVIPRGERGRPVYRWAPEQVDVLERQLVLRRKPSA